MIINRARPGVELRQNQPITARSGRLPDPVVRPANVARPSIDRPAVGRPGVQPKGPAGVAPGTVFQKDLGARTAEVAAAIEAYDPGDDWSEVGNAE